MDKTSGRPRQAVPIAVLRRSLPALALAAGLSLAACGDDGGTDSASTGASSNGHGGSHTSDGSKESAEANEADVSFLTGMKPHHEQAVEMSEIVLAKNPPAEVADLAREIQAAQSPEIQQLNAILADLGASFDPGAHSGHGDNHGGMMSEQELAALRAATGKEAARLFLTAMIAHHEGAIEASDAEIADGEHEPAVQLAEQIKQAQAAEIVRMREMLARL